MPDMIVTLKPDAPLKTLRDVGVYAASSRSLLDFLSVELGVVKPRDLRDGETVGLSYSSPASLTSIGYGVYRLDAVEALVAKLKDQSFVASVEPNRRVNSP